MHYEVENKFPVREFSRVFERLQELGAEFHDEVEQVDIYFGHPVRDFATTDEALRIRRIGETNLLTYKGPKIDTTTKTRREVELPLASGAQYLEQYTQLLIALGFQTVAEVKKHRRRGHLRWSQWSVQLALDQVARLGQFVELEIVADEEQLASAQSAVRTLATRLGLAQPERRSYLEMVLDLRAPERRRHPPSNS
jgi:adenylate cyclase class 2